MGASSSRSSGSGSSRFSKSTSKSSNITRSDEDECRVKVSTKLRASRIRQVDERDAKKTSHVSRKIRFFRRRGEKKSSSSDEESTEKVQKWREEADSAVESSESSDESSGTTPLPPTEITQNDMLQVLLKARNEVRAILHVATLEDKNAQLERMECAILYDIQQLKRRGRPTDL